MTNQEAFNTALAGIVAQGALAQEDRGEGIPPACSYFNGEGNKCAIGQLLDDDTAKDWQACGVGSIRYASWDLLDATGLDQVDMGFLSALQTDHDTARSVDQFVNNARRTAERFNLEFPA